MSTEATVLPRGIHRRTEFELTKSLRRRFLGKIDMSGECWEWTGAIRNGYGTIKHEGKNLSTHVVAYRIFHGEIPPGCLVCHKCDNRLCCNPDHLYAGTYSDNARDMHDRRRFAAPRGEDVPQSVLTEDLVREIMRLFRHRSYGARRIATRLGLNENTVKGVVAGRTWRHVTGL